LHLRALCRSSAIWESYTSTAYISKA
jgi:hypothetical protein